MIPEYLIPFNLNKLPKEHTDVLIIGSGIAGLYTALNIKEDLAVTVVAKEELKECNTYKAQGGVAVAMDEGDLPLYHYEDTMKSGAGVASSEAVKVLTDEGPQNINNLIQKAKAEFDRQDNGCLSFSMEGAHSRSRVVHYKDYTGKHIEEKLIKAVTSRGNINVMENCAAIDLLRDNGKVYGALIYDGKETFVIYASRIILATGGIGMIYRNSTNSYIATSDGIAMALRAGAKLKDMEFVQFHPTGFKQKDGSCFLISEAIRGEGAILRNREGEAFMEKYHPMKDLATRDIVARAILSEMQKADELNMWLDITFEDRDFLEERFEQIFEVLLKNGIDMSKDLIPVSPVQHYFMGGIMTDVNGRTSLEGLYAVGECACTGIHGANRLASNSLLEGLVFGRRIADDINAQEHLYVEFQGDKVYDREFETIGKDIGDLTMELRNICENYVGPLRDEEGLTKAVEFLSSTYEEISSCTPLERNELEVINMYQTAVIIAKAALMRRESRGAHYRKDYELPREEYLKNVICWLEEGEIVYDELDIR